MKCKLSPYCTTGSTRRIEGKLKGAMDDEKNVFKWD
jgi:hypothetical protein